MEATALARDRRRPAAGRIRPELWPAALPLSVLGIRFWEFAFGNSILTGSVGGAGAASDLWVGFAKTPDGASTDRGRLNDERARQLQDLLSAFASYAENRSALKAA
jgi:hypothetical protein